MGIEDIVGKIEVFEKIVGQKPYQGKILGDIPAFEIKNDKVDEIYLTLKKMQRDIIQDRGNLNAKDYLSDFEDLDIAFVERNMALFKEAVTNLMISIDYDKSTN
jgi:hypothetical protein